MTDSSVQAPASAASAERVFCPDSTGRGLLEAAVRAVQGRGCRDLDRIPLLGRRPGLRARERTSALLRDAYVEATPIDEVFRLDASAVAAWITGRYPQRTYPGVLLGSVHGAVAHLAAVLDVPWLPSGFTVSVPWLGGRVGDGEGALDWGAFVAERILAGNPDVTVRQVHDPMQRGALCGSTLTLHVRWTRLPEAYREFLATHLAPGGIALALRDLRNWPVLELAPRHSFQIGSPVSGRPADDYTMDNPSFRRLLAGLSENQWSVPPDPGPSRYAELTGEPGFDQDLRRCGSPAHRVLYPSPSVLSAFTADLHRQWWGTEGRAADRCVVETGSFIDPWHVLSAGLVPYWCESAAQRAVDAAGWWLAGSEAFDEVAVLPQPPGVRSETYATAPLWRSLAAFAGTRPHVDKLAMTRYPMLPMAAARASSALATMSPADPAPPPRMPVAGVLAALRSSGPGAGLLVA
ncbi:hypothetical protein AB0J80_21425 [Actinoplanes sp. NPDC049548]|uniref:hypothetical protein n=1 Tax=Actinoplanes sp. NPDC049548 TaxID=3155152 RepID=UPI00342031D8